MDDEEEEDADSKKVTIKNLESIDAKEKDVQRS